MKVGGSSYSNFYGVNYIQNNAVTTPATTTAMPNYCYNPPYLNGANWFPMETGMPYGTNMGTFGVNSYTKLGTTMVNGKIYEQYKLSNGTTVLINSDPNAKTATVSTAIKNTAYGNGLFKNQTEAHLFEHMFANPKNTNNGYFEQINDGSFGNKVNFETNCNNVKDIKNIINNQTNAIYNASFNQGIFNREKQILNLELAIKTNGAGNRSEIEDIDLNHLKQIRNQLVRPDNMEIVIDGNVNPEKLMYEISRSKANTTSNQIRKLNNEPYQKIKLYDGNEIESVQLKTKTRAGLNREKTVSALALARTMALISGENSMNEKARTLSYGPYIKITQNEDGAINFTYDNETFSVNKNKLQDICKSNFRSLKYRPMSDIDFKNAQKTLLSNIDLFYDKDLQGLISKEDLIANVENMSRHDVKRAVRRLHIEK